MAMRSEVTGNVLIAPVLKKIPGRGDEEQTICELRLMSAEYRDNGRGGVEQVEERTFPVQVTIFGESQARRVYEHIKVGASVIAVGRFYVRAWKDDQGNAQPEGRLYAERVALNLQRVESVKFRDRAAGEPPADTGDGSGPTPF
ncbi:single-stranded DNA-binding protein [Achromobacter aloeverae]